MPKRILDGTFLRLVGQRVVVRTEFLRVLDLAIDIISVEEEFATRVIDKYTKVEATGERIATALSESCFCCKLCGLHESTTEIKDEQGHPRIDEQIRCMAHIATDPIGRLADDVPCRDTWRSMPYP